MSRTNASDRSDKPETIFQMFEVGFPDLQEGDKINTAQFLEACKGIVIVVEKLGKLFAPVKHDIQNNIKKITKKYNQNPAKYEFLEDMILDEKKMGGNVTVDALMWLRRGLHFLLTLLQGILSDREDGELKENLTPYLKASYEVTLQRYHGWLGAQLFNVLSRYASSTKSFLATLALDCEDKEEIVLEDMKIFSVLLSKCVEKLIKFYSMHNLETNYVV